MMPPQLYCYLKNTDPRNAMALFNWLTDESAVASRQMLAALDFEKRWKVPKNCWAVKERTSVAVGLTDTVELTDPATIKELRDNLNEGTKR